MCGGGLASGHVSNKTCETLKNLALRRAHHLDLGLCRIMIDHIFLHHIFEYDGANGPAGHPDLSGDSKMAPDSCPGSNRVKPKHVRRVSD